MLSRYTAIVDRPMSLPPRSFLSCIVITLALTVGVAFAQPERPTNTTEPSTTTDPTPTDATIENRQSPDPGGGCCGRCGGADGASRGSGARKRGACCQGAKAGEARGNECPQGGRGRRPEAELAHFLIDNHDRVQRSVELYPLYNQGLLTLGRFALHQDKLELAIDAFNRVLQLQPSSDHALVGLARVWLKRHKPESARKYLQSALEINPANQKAQELLRSLDGSQSTDSSS